MTSENRRYTKEHEWIRAEGTDGIVGITEHAVEQLGDVTFIEFVEKGREVAMGDVVGTVESVKAASEIYAPVSGRIEEVNARLEEAPELVNESPYENGWLVKIAMTDPSELDDLLDAGAYGAYLKSLEK